MKVCPCFLVFCAFLLNAEQSASPALKTAATAAVPAPSASGGSAAVDPAPVGAVAPLPDEAFLDRTLRSPYAPIKPPVFPTPSWFVSSFRKPETRVELRPPVRLEDFVVEGRLELSLRSYIDLVLANNTDIEIQRVSVETFRNNILRQYSLFDPTLLASFNSTRTSTPASDALAGAITQIQLQQPFQFRFQQLLPIGTTYSIGFNARKTSTNSAFALFNPALNADLNISFTQPLLRNRGAYVTKLPVTIARSRVRLGEYSTEDQIMRLVAAAETAYWDVVQARENLRVQEQALALADELLKRAQRELELGAISSLEIYQPQQQYATYEIAVTQARYRLAQAEDVLRRQMGADLDPKIRNLPIVLTEPITPPVELPLDKEELVQRALRLRPDVKAARQNLDLDDLQIQVATNQLRPDLSLTAQYGAFGRGGPFYQRTNVFSGDGTRSTVVSIVPGGFADALEQLFGFGFPTYGFGLTLRFPLRDRRASADYADAVLNKRLDTLRVRAVEQNVRLEVLNAINQVENSRASVELAKVALDFAQKRVDADRKRYDLGTITLYFLLDAQTALNRAQSDLVNQSVNYRKNLTNLHRATGELLYERNIALR